MGVTTERTPVEDGDVITAATADGLDEPVLDEIDHLGVAIETD